MKLVCKSCQFEFEFDASGKEARTPCPNCASEVEIVRPTTPPASVWQMRYRDGRVESFDGAATLQRMIDAYTVTREDELSRDGVSWKPLGSLEKVAKLFAKRDAANPNPPAPKSNPPVVEPAAPPPAATTTSTEPTRATSDATQLQVSPAPSTTSPERAAAPAPTSPLRAPTPPATTPLRAPTQPPTTKATPLRAPTPPPIGNASVPKPSPLRAPTPPPIGSSSIPKPSPLRAPTPPPIGNSSVPKPSPLRAPTPPPVNTAALKGSAPIAPPWETTSTAPPSSAVPSDADRAKESAAGKKDAPESAKTSPPTAAKIALPLPLPMPSSEPISSVDPDADEYDRWDPDPDRVPERSTSARKSTPPVEAKAAPATSAVSSTAVTIPPAKPALEQKAPKSLVEAAAPHRADAKQQVPPAGTHPSLDLEPTSSNGLVKVIVAILVIAALCGIAFLVVKYRSESTPTSESTSDAGTIQPTPAPVHVAVVDAGARSAPDASLADPAGFIVQAEFAGRRYPELISRGRDLLQAGDRDRARSAFQAALVQHPTSAEAYAELGFVELLSHNYLVASADFRRALANDPTYSNADVGLAQSEVHQGNLDAAIRADQHYLTVFPNGPYASTARNEIGSLRRRSARGPNAP